MFQVEGLGQSVQKKKRYTGLHYSLKVATHLSSTGMLAGSTFVKWMPIPPPGREKATRPVAATVAPPRTILSLSLVPSGNGLGVSTKQPNRLISLRCAVSWVSDCKSVISTIAVKEWRGGRWCSLLMAEHSPVCGNFMPTGVVPEQKTPANERKRHSVLKLLYP